MTLQLAPDFSLLDQEGNVRTLKNFQGSWLILYFYPKDDTPGCTKEACNFRDSLAELNKLGVKVVGISKGSVASHKKFATKYDLQFPLLSDPDHKVIEAYSAWGEKHFMGKLFLGILRMTYLINPKGEIIKTYPKVNPTVHAKEIKKDLTKLLVNV